MKNRIMKVSAVSAATSLTLAGCGLNDYEEVNSVNVEVSEAPSVELTREEYLDHFLHDGLLMVEGSEYYPTCEQWQASDDGAYQCIEENSPYYGQYFFNGQLYPTLDDMMNDSMYIYLNKWNGLAYVEGAGLQSVQSTAYAQSCESWQDDEDGSAQCIDEDSPYYSQHFFNGVMFASLAAMTSSAMYSSLNKRDGYSQKYVQSSPRSSKVSGGSGASGRSGFSSGGAARGGSAGS